MGIKRAHTKSDCQDAGVPHAGCHHNKAYVHLSVPQQDRVLLRLGPKHKWASLHERLLEKRCNI